MFRKKLATILNGVKGERTMTFETGANIFRRNHSVRRDRKSQAETDTGLVDPNLAMWRSINADHKEVEQVPTDQTENILNYYKDRWIQEHKEKNEVETISGNEVSREPKSSDKKSLYSQLARKCAPMNKGHTSNNVPMGFQSNDPTTIQSYDPFKLQKSAPHGPLQDVENKEHGMIHGNMRQSESIPSFWSSEKSPYHFSPPERHNNNQGNYENQKQLGNQTSQQSSGKKPQDMAGPYRPSFSMANMMGSKTETSRKDKDVASSLDENLTKGHDSKKDNGKSESDSSTSFKSAPPPVPDFKSP